MPGARYAAKASAFGGSWLPHRPANHETRRFKVELFRFRNLGFATPLLHVLRLFNFQHNGTQNRR